MKTEKKYEQWKAITESDFVTLFIKTWFTYIASLRELNPDVKVFTDEGTPRGDKPFLNAFKDGIMPIVQKQLPVKSVAQELFSMYPVSMRKVMDVFPQYFFQTFFRINESFNYTDKSVEKDSDGKIKERYEAHLHIVERYCLKFYLGVSGCFRTTNYNEQIKKEVDLRSIIEEVVSKHRDQNPYVNEMQFMRDFYNGVMNEVSKILRHYMDDTLPSKRYNQTVNGKIRDACLRLISSLNVKFDFNYKYPHEVGALDDLNSYAIIYQLPFNGFGRMDQDNVYAVNEGTYSQLMATKGVDWFAGYVYSLRNALFHEIITPLDEEWQTIFKSAYLILKQISDICIEVLNRILEFPTIKENQLFDYVTDHPEVLYSQGNEGFILSDFLGMRLDTWKVDNENIEMSGSFVALLYKEEGIEVQNNYHFEITLDNDFSIVDKAISITNTNAQK